jgi:hypothetical protein
MGDASSIQRDGTGSAELATARLRACHAPRATGLLAHADFG